MFFCFHLSFFIFSLPGLFTFIRKGANPYDFLLDVFIFSSLSFFITRLHLYNEAHSHFPPHSTANKANHSASTFHPFSYYFVSFSSLFQSCIILNNYTAHNITVFFIVIILSTSLTVILLLLFYPFFIVRRTYTCTL